MHPLMLTIMIACGGWFFACAVMAGKGMGARFGIAFLGVVEFLIVFAIFEQIMKHQDFFLRALRSGPDIGPILIYVVFPTGVVVFLSGLWIKSAHSNSSRTDREP